MIGLVRLVLFFLAGSLGVVNLYNLERIFDNYYITEQGFEKMEDVPAFYLFVEWSVFFMRTLFSFLVLFRLIQVPTKAPNKEQQRIDDGYVWATFLAILLLSLGTNTDHNLGFETFMGSTNETAHHFGFNFATNDTHLAARVVSAVAKIVCILWGLISVITNTARPGTFVFDKGIPWHRWVIGFLDCSVFLVGGAYTLYNIFVMHPGTLKTNDPNVADFLGSWATEFYLYQSAELILSIIGVALTFYSYFMYEAKSSDKTVIALSHGYRVFILGWYTSTSATWHAHALEVYQNGKTPGVTIFAITPFVYFLVVSLLTTIYRFSSTSIVRTLRDGANVVALIGVRLFHLSGSVLFWRIGNALCIFAMIHLLILGFAEWVHITVSPGTIATNVEDVVFSVENTIVDAGEKAFTVLKDLDPCRWSMDDNQPSTQLNEDIAYSYELGGMSKTRSFNMRDRDATASKMKCQCKENAQGCDCDFINRVNENITITHANKERFVSNSGLTEFDSITELEKFESDSKYHEHLQKCHSIECDIVLGAAIAAETALLGSDFLWIFGPAEGAVADAAWFAQQANRIGHNVIKYGMSLAKTLAGLLKRVSNMRPMIKTFQFLAKLETVIHFSPGVGQLLVALPVIILGLFSIMASLFKRENINSAIMEVALVTKLYIPAVMVAWSMAALVFVVPTLIERLIKSIPTSIITSTIKETQSLVIIRYVYIISATGATFIMLSSVLTGLIKLRKSGNRILKLFREPANAFFRRNSQYSQGVVGDNSEVSSRAGQGAIMSWYSRITSSIDQTWLQGFLVSSVVVILFIFSITNDHYLIRFHYGPTDMFIGTLSSLRAHATVHSHSADVATVSREGLCGLIGKGVKLAIKAAVEELEVIFSKVEEELGHFLGLIEEFLGLSDVFDNLGRISMEIFDSGWSIIEFTLAYSVPLFNTGLFLFVTFAKTYFVKKGRKEDAEMLASFCTSLIETLLYYNIGMLVVVHQAYGILQTADFKIFYVGMEAGPLFSMAAASILLNALSLMGLYVSSIYPLKED